MGGEWLLECAWVAHMQLSLASEFLFCFAEVSQLSTLWLAVVAGWLLEFLRFLELLAFLGLMVLRVMT